MKRIWIGGLVIKIVYIWKLSVLIGFVDIKLVVVFCCGEDKVIVLVILILKLMLKRVLLWIGLYGIKILSFGMIMWSVL